MSAPIFDIYIRVSRTNGRDGDSYQSPTEQERACRELAARRGWEVARVVVEEDVSGGKRVRDRALEELVRRVEDGPSSGILAFNVKRFARSVAEGAAAINRIKAADGEFCDSYGNSTRENSLAINIYLAIGEDELEKLTEQWSRSSSNARALGKFVGPVPFGYVRHDGRLFEHETEAPIVREVFRRVARGTLADGVDYLAAAAPTRTRRRKGRVESYAVVWNTDNVRKLVRSRTYLGEHGRGGDAGYRRHEPLTTEALFQAASTKLTPTERRRNGDYLLSGLVFCAQCGEPLTGQFQSFKHRPETYRRYRCSAKSCGGGSSVNADKLDVYVRAELRELFADETRRGALLPEGVDDARLEWERAKERKRRFALAVDPLDDDFADGAAMHAERVREAGAEYRRLVGLAQTTVDVPKAERLDDDGELVRALRMAAAGGLTLALRRGRGALDDRVVWRRGGEVVPREIAA
jgi:DNA invertase Pin-like site-specific DNA recombinase